MHVFGGSSSSHSWYERLAFEVHHVFKKYKKQSRHMHEAADTGHSRKCTRKVFPITDLVFRAMLIYFGDNPIICDMRRSLGAGNKNQAS